MTRFTDKVDVNTVISLHEYGVIRDPETEQTVMMVHNMARDRMVAYSDYISDRDVFDAIMDAPPGFFDYMGQSKEDMLEEVDNCHLAHFIMSLNSYCGEFNSGGF